jgi:hypothetical protein
MRRTIDKIARGVAQAGRKLELVAVRAREAAGSTPEERLLARGGDPLTLVSPTHLDRGRSKLGSAGLSEG